MSLVEPHPQTFRMVVNSGDPNLVRALFKAHGTKLFNAVHEIEHVICEADIAILRTLLDLGMNPNMQDSWHGRTLLHTLGQFGNRPDLIRLLVERGADINLSGDSGYAFYEFILNMENDKFSDEPEWKECLLTFLALGADPTLRHWSEAKDWIDCCGTRAQDWRHAEVALLFACGMQGETELYNRSEMQEEIANAKAKLRRYRIEFFRDRALEVCIALQSLELPALLTMMILDEGCVIADLVPIDAKWEIVVTVKHATF